MKFEIPHRSVVQFCFCGAVLFSEAVLPDTDQDDLYLEIYC